MHKNSLYLSLAMPLLYITFDVNVYIHFKSHTEKCIHISTSKVKNHTNQSHQFMQYSVLFSLLIPRDLFLTAF
jgi:hypothetical protein